MLNLDFVWVLVSFGGCGRAFCLTLLLWMPIRFYSKCKEAYCKWKVQSVGGINLHFDCCTFGGPGPRIMGMGQ